VEPVTRAVLPERLRWRPGAAVAKALVPVTRVGEAAMPTLDKVRCREKKLITVLIKTYFQTKKKTSQKKERSTRAGGRPAPSFLYCFNVC
jgi:hypothetical protein